jgi:hypothetical protein
MPSRINERVVNGALADILNGSAQLPGIAEATRQDSGGAAPDILIRPSLSSRSSVAIEAKVGNDATQHGAAVDDALSRLRSTQAAYAAIALCYPSEVAFSDTQSQMVRRLRTTRDLQFTEVSHDGEVADWQRGSWQDLATAIAYAGERTVAKMVAELNRGISGAIDCLSHANRRAIARALDLPGERSKDDKCPNFDKAAKIGCLLIANGVLMQARLYDAGVLSEVDIEMKSISRIVASSDPKGEFWSHWSAIRAIDYHPIYDAALKALDAIPDSEMGTSAVRTIAESAVQVSRSFEYVRSDLAGRIYHRLLDTAQFDGSFYTSTPAAILLSRLALPRDLIDWSDPNRIADLRICDPACGTGTLLMAAAQTVRDRHLAGGGNGATDDLLHLTLVEDVINGLDINLSAVHLAASMLALSNPKVDFNRMGVYRAKFGIERNGGANGAKAWLGSLEMLQGNEPRLQFPDFERSSGEGEEDTYPDLRGKCDLVIMNPPYTRNSLRHDQLSNEDEKLMRKAERKLIDCLGAGDITDLTSISPAFTLLANELCKANAGKFAKIMPSTAGVNTSGVKERIFYSDNWQVDLVITSHDPRRIYFSEDTTITESLMLATRREADAAPQPTKFINLTRNPANAFDALGLTKDIEEDDLVNWGTVQWNPAEAMTRGDWLPMVFYDGELTEVARMLRTGLRGTLKPIGDLATLEPDGRAARGYFREALVRQSPDTRSLWEHRTSERKTLRSVPDRFIAPRIGREDAAMSYWKQRSRLLLANRLYPVRAATPATLCDIPVIGSAWVPVTPTNDTDQLPIMKAWCVWANSSCGVISFLAISQRKLTYPAFSMEGLRSLPFPDPEVCPDAIESLAAIYEELSDSELLPLSQADRCETRAQIDAAVADAFKGQLDQIHDWRDKIAVEPNVCLRPAECATL